LRSSPEDVLGSLQQARRRGDIGRLAHREALAVLRPIW
jgi:hypothetical protein